MYRGLDKFAFGFKETDNICMGIGKEILIGVDPELRVARLNRIEVQRAERGRQRVHLMERLLAREPKRKDLERKQHLEERKIRKKNSR